MTDAETAVAAPVPGPRFAPEAEQLLAAGDLPGALALARAGAERYPWYPGGLLVLGRCHEAAGRMLEALMALRDASRLLPDAPVIGEALSRLEAAQVRADQRQELPGAGSGSASGEAPGSPEPPITGFPVAGEPPADAAPPRDEPPAAAEPAAGAGEAADVESLARRLQGAKRIVPPPPPAPASGEAGSASPDEEMQPDEPEAYTPAAANPQFVSVTLAEIYVEQQQFGEAIRAYRTLMERQPAEREKYEKRIEEIEELVRKHLFGE